MGGDTRSHAARRRSLHGRCLTTHGGVRGGAGCARQVTSIHSGTGSSSLTTTTHSEAATEGTMKELTTKASSHHHLPKAPTHPGLATPSWWTTSESTLLSQL